jgi:hypothetical protein
LKKSFAFYGVCAILAGFLWAVFKYLVNHTPSPFSYDDYNRFLTLPLVLMLICSFGIYHLLLKPLRGMIRVSGILLVSSFTLLLLGNMIEFWFVLFQDQENAYAAWQSGSNEIWVGSHIGWATFIIGSLLYTITSCLLGIVLLVKTMARYWNLLISLFGLIGTLSFGPEVFLIPYAIGWLFIGGYFFRRSRVAVMEDWTTDTRNL